MDADRERIERARLKNLEYIRQLDESKASQEADEFLASVVGSPTASTKPGRPSSGGKSKGNSSVYITGLTTYMACRQLEGVCAKIGKVRRIKFYKDERGGLKGDAVVTFSSRITMTKAIDRTFTSLLLLIRISYLATQLNHFEVKPGVIITATEAVFSNNKAKEANAAAETNQEESEVPVEESKVGGVTSEIAPQDTQPPSDDGTAKLDLPSRAIVLKHIWDPLEQHDSSDAAFFEDLEDDMRSECSKHGAVEHVQIVADGSVIVRFTELNAAIACLKVMNGRWFAGQQIEAQFDQTAPEEPSDADTKMEAFLASLGE